MEDTEMFRLSILPTSSEMQPFDYSRVCTTREGNIVGHGFKNRQLARSRTDSIS